MIVGIGLDVIELGRIQKAVLRRKRFVDRILTRAEKEQYETLSESRKIEFLAGRFAAKEAYAKARGTGIGKLSWQDIEVKTDNGRPVIIATDMRQEKVHMTITHTKAFAAAQVIITK